MNPNFCGGQKRYMPNALDLEIHDLINFILGDIQKPGSP